MLEIHWLVLIIIIFVSMIAYSFLFALFYKTFMEGYKGRYLFNLPLAPFSLKSRIYTVAKQLGVDESDVKYLEDNTYKVNDEIYEVEGFFGVAVFHVKDGERLGTVSDEVSNYNLANLRHESGELGDSNNKNKKSNSKELKDSNKKELEDSNNRNKKVRTRGQVEREEGV